MLLCLDIGNTHLLGGVYAEEKLILRFRYATHLLGTADQFGIFLLNILAANHLQAAQIKAVAICSVVPSYDFTVRHMISQYLQAEHFFLTAEKAAGLDIHCDNPQELGADRLATSIAAVNAYPHKSLIVVDMGTATTLCAIGKSGTYLGGAILPGMRLSMEALKSNTAQLMEVDIEQPQRSIGKTTRENIQSGLFFGNLGALKELVQQFNATAFSDDNAFIVATGGFAQLYKDAQLFDVILPDLVLQGLYIVYMNSRLD